MNSRSSCFPPSVTLRVPPLAGEDQVPLLQDHRHPGTAGLAGASEESGLSADDTIVDVSLQPHFLNWIASLVFPSDCHVHHAIERLVGVGRGA